MEAQAPCHRMDPGVLRFLDSPKLQMEEGGETLIFTILHFPVARWVEGYAGIQDKYGQLYTICVCAAFIILLIMGRLRHKEVKRVVYACLQAGTDLMLHWLFRVHAEDLACLPRELHV